MNKTARKSERGGLLAIAALLLTTSGYAAIMVGAQCREWDVFEGTPRTYMEKSATYGWPMNHGIRSTQYLLPSWQVTEMNREWYAPYLTINIVVISLMTASVGFASWDLIGFIRCQRTFSIAAMFVVTASVAGVFALDNVIYILTTMQWDRISWPPAEKSWPFRIAVWIGLFCVAHVAIVTACDLLKLAGRRFVAIAGKSVPGKMSIPGDEL